MTGDPWLEQIHKRLLAADPTASAELAERVLGLLAGKLQHLYSEVQDPHLVPDAVTDAVFGYIKNPQQFDPTKRGLMGFLLMAAEGDLKNSLAKRRRREHREVDLANVELEGLSGKGIARAVDTVSAIEAARLRQELIAIFATPTDQQIVELILDGERSTEAYVRVLGLEGCSPAEQRSEVKRQKDRIKKRLERCARGIRESE